MTTKGKKMTKRFPALAALSVFALSADANALATDAVCTAVGSLKPLPTQIRESSGLAQSRRDPGVFWTHNDAGNAPIVFAVSGDGAMRSQARITGARLEDWEDIESGTCGGANCLYIADIGDNDATRSMITVYQVEEPAIGAAASANAVVRTARYPGGPRDAEGMFVLSGTIYVVTKGRTGPIELYRWPPGQGTVTLTKVAAELAGSRDIRVSQSRREVGGSPDVSHSVPLQGVRAHGFRKGNAGDRRPECKWREPGRRSRNPE
jgi:hypothetical protein